MRTNLAYVFEVRISRKRKYNFWRKSSVKNFCQSNDNNWAYVFPFDVNKTSVVKYILPRTNFKTPLNWTLQSFGRGRNMAFDNEMSNDVLSFHIGQAFKAGTTDKGTDVWSRPLCIYTQIFSPFFVSKFFF